MPPTCTVAVERPDSICFASASAWLIGIANASVAPTVWKEKPTDAAVFMPMTRLEPSSSGPPESPGWSAAFVSIRPSSCSAPFCSSDAVIVLPRPTIAPRTVDSFPVPPALPVAVTCWPTCSFEEFPTVAVRRFDAPLSWSTATSSATS